MLANSPYPTDVHFTERDDASMTYPIKEDVTPIVDQSTDKSVIEEQQEAASSTTQPSDNGLDAQIRAAYQQLPIPKLEDGNQIYSQLDRYGFIRQDTTTNTSTSLEQAKEGQRAMKWLKMAKPCSHDEHSPFTHTFDLNTKFIRRVYKGIPDCWRAQVWQVFIHNV
jgi:hypothetical protein